MFGKKRKVNIKKGKKGFQKTTPKTVSPSTARRNYVSQGSPITTPYEAMVEATRDKQYNHYKKKTKPTEWKSSTNSSFGVMVNNTIKKRNS
jgi:hypothetical protein